MEQVHYDITLPLGEQPIRQVLTVKRFDSHATLWFRLTHGGRAYRITEDCMGVFTAKKPDGTVIYNPCRREGNAFVYSLTPQTTALPGQLRCELRLYGPGEKLITTAAFLLEVADTVYSGDEELASSQEAEALTQLIDHTRQNLDRMEVLLEEAEQLTYVDDTQIGNQAWSAKKLVETFCPPLEETAPVVSGMPLRDYPLDITTQAEAATEQLALTRCGKNLFDFRKGTQRITISSAANVQKTFSGYEIHLPAGTYTLHPEKISGDAAYIYGVINDKEGFYKQSCSLVIHDTLQTQTVTLEQGDVIYIYNGIATNDVNITNAVFAQYNIQLELGTKATPYEPYHGVTETVELSGFDSVFQNGAIYHWNTGLMTDEVGEYWQHDPETGTFTSIADIEGYETRNLRQFYGSPGVNYIYSNTGQVIVKGKKDPAALLAMLSG